MALKHPWITRQFDSPIPLTFEQQNVSFQNQEKFVRIIKSMMIVRYLQRFRKEMELEQGVDSNQNQNIDLNMDNTNASICQSVHISEEQLKKYQTPEKPKIQVKYMKRQSEVIRNVIEKNQTDNKSSRQQKQINVDMDFKQKFNIILKS